MVKNQKRQIGRNFIEVDKKERKQYEKKTCG